MKPLPSSVAVALFTAAGFSPTVYGQPFVFTKIADNSTVVPNTSPAANFQLFGAPSLSEGRIAFGAVSSPVSGVYEWNAGTLVRVVDSTTMIPQTGGSFVNAGPSDNDGERIVIVGNNGTNGGVYQRSGGVVSRIADTLMNAPNGGAFANAANASVEGSSIAFFGAHTTLQGPKPAVYRWDSGTITTVADTNTNVPGGTGKFNDFVARSVRVDSGAAWFNGVSAGSTKSGIYKRPSGGALQAVLDTGTDAPPGQGKFTGFGNFGVDGDDVLFIATTESGSPVASGLFTRIDGQITKLFSTGDPAPGGGNYGFIDSLSLEGSTAVFLDSTNSVLYTNLGGTVQRIVGPGDMLGGKFVGSVGFSHAGRDGNTLAFTVTFTPQHQPPVSYDTAVYTVTIATPGAMLPFGAAALLAARRSR